MNLSKNTTTIIAILILVAGVAAYIFFFGKKPVDTVTSSSGPTTAAETTFINLTSQIDPVSFDTSIFTDPRFMSLQDIRVTVIPEASGRKDPFAPL
jgi:xanthine/uracil permease